MKKPEFRQFIKNILLEVKNEKAQSDDTEKKKSKDYLDSTDSKFKQKVDGGFNDTSEKLLQQIIKVVKSIDKNANATLDDHNDITAILPGTFRIRISARGAGTFNVEAFRNMTDRVYAIALSKEQVLDFVKVNFATSKKGYVQSAYDKSLENLKDKSEKKAKELPKGNAVKQIDVSDKDKEDLGKEHDQSAALEAVEDVERQEDHGIEKNKQMPKIQKAIKKEVDNDLTKSWKK